MLKRVVRNLDEIFLQRKIKVLNLFETRRFDFSV